MWAFPVGYVFSPYDFFNMSNVITPSKLHKLHQVDSKAGVGGKRGKMEDMYNT